MADPDRPLFDDLKHEIGRLAAGFEAMFALRFQLARLEFDAALASIKRLGLVWAVAATMGLTGLPVLVVGIALLLPLSETMRAGCLLLVGLVLILVAVLTAWSAWRQFRREFVGLEESLEELREDRVWIREWAGRSDEDEETATGE